jgi:hypothetical protein
MPQNSRRPADASRQNSQRAAGVSRQADAVPEFHDNQQIQDNNQTSGASDAAGQTSGDAAQPTDVPNYAANRDPAEGPRDGTGAIWSRPRNE